jgi:branched-chain amino acid transport system permease protein
VAPGGRPVRWWGARAAAVALGAALAALPLVAPTYYLHLLTLTFCYGIMAMSLDLLVGYTGLSSLGHAAYFGVAGYTVGILATRYAWGFWPALALALLAALVVAALFGLLAMRATGPYFLIITLALGQIIWGLAYRWVSMTGGDNGLRGIPRPALGLGLHLGAIQHFYYFALAVAALAASLMCVLTASHFGLTLRGVRESESRMRALGYNVWLHKYLAFVIAGAFSGLGGVLYAYYNQFVSPADVSLVASANALLMVVLGGSGTLWGSMIGAALLVFLQNLISGVTQRWLTILGAVLVLSVLYAPEGIVGAARAPFARAALRPGPRAAPVPTAEPHP